MVCPNLATFWKAVLSCKSIKYGWRSLSIVVNIAVEQKSVPAQNMQSHKKPRILAVTFSSERKVSASCLTLLPVQEFLVILV